MKIKKYLLNYRKLIEILLVKPVIQFAQTNSPKNTNVKYGQPECFHVLHFV